LRHSRRDARRAAGVGPHRRLASRFRCWRRRQLAGAWWASGSEPVGWCCFHPPSGLRILLTDPRTQALRAKLGLGPAARAGDAAQQRRHSHAAATSRADEEPVRLLRAMVQDGAQPEALRLKELPTLLQDYRRLVLERTRRGPAPGGDDPQPAPLLPHAARLPVFRFFHTDDARALALRDVPALMEEYRGLLRAAGSDAVESQER
jgi:hypothetical protein